jgi:ABC-2 type transport system permease protein
MNRPVHKDTGWRLFLRTAVGRSYPRVIGMQRSVSGLVFDVGLPLIGLVAYVLMYRSIGAAETFIGFVIIGGAMSAFWLNVMWSMASQLFWEKESGMLGLYIIAPTSLMALLTGMAIGGMFAASLRVAAVIVIGSWIFHVHYAIASAPMLILAFVLTLVSLYALGMILASLFLLYGREAWHLVNLSQEPVYLLSGLYFPVRSLSFWVATAASIIPLTLGLDAVRQLVFASAATLGFLAPKIEIGILFGLSVLFLVGAQEALRYMERIAIEEGRLTESRA